jgi:hypothetical protein
MATMDDDEDLKREPDADADDEGSPDDVIVPADPQIMTMTGAPPAAAGPQPDPRQRAFSMGGPNHFGGPGGGFLQQLFARIQQARQARQQQFAQSPMGQQFIASPMGQRMEQRFPNMPMFGQQQQQAAGPPTAAQAANEQATAAQQQPAAAAPPETEETTTTTKTKRPYREQRPPAGVQQPQQRGALPTFGGNANASIQDAMRARMGGGGGMRRGMF